MKKGKILNGYGVFSLILILYLFFAYQKEQRVKIQEKAGNYDRIVQLASEIGKLKEDIKALEDDIKNAKTPSEENYARIEKVQKEKILAEKEAEKENMIRNPSGGIVGSES